MTRRDWWLGILLPVAAISTHAAMNRYSWQVYSIEGQVPNLRAALKIDRWTGTMTHEPAPRLDLDELYLAQPLDAARTKKRPPISHKRIGGPPI